MSGTISSMLSETAHSETSDVALVGGAIDGAEALSAFTTGLPGAVGGVAVFVGRIRPERHGALGDLVAIEYDAYEPMATAALDSIAREEATRGGAERLRVRHSVGRVGVGEVGVFVGVGARHRRAAFAVCQAVMDRLKAEAPIWKRQIWSHGATWQGAPGPSGAPE